MVHVGDAVWDVRASAALQIRCIRLESGGTSASELHQIGAFETWRDPGTLLEGFEKRILGSVAWSSRTHRPIRTLALGFGPRPPRVVIRICTRSGPKLRKESCCDELCRTTR